MVVERLEEMRLKREEQLRACVDNDMADYLRCKMSAIAEAIDKFLSSSYKRNPCTRYPGRRFGSFLFISCSIW